MCLIAKSELKMIKFSSSFKLNESHTVDSPFNEDYKIFFFFREALISGEEGPENLGKLAITGTCIIMQIGGGEFRKRISAPNRSPGTKILVMPQFSYMPD